MTFKDSRTMVLIKLITVMVRIRSFNDRTIQAIVVQIYLNDFIVELRNELTINGARFVSPEKMS